MNVDELIAEVVRLRDEGTELNKKVEDNKEQRARIEAQLMDLMGNLNLSQVGSAHGTASMKRKTTHVISNFDEFSQFIIENKRVDLLQKRVSPTAVKELLDDEIDVPGITAIENWTVSILRK